MGLRGITLLVCLVLTTSCGTKGPLENRKVAIPSASFTCTDSDGCANIPAQGRLAAVYWTTSECTLANINAKKFAAEGVTLLSPTTSCTTSDTGVVTCTDTVTTWYDNAEESVKITTMPLGYYSLCGFLDANDSEVISDTEPTKDYFGEKKKIGINDLTVGPETLSSFSALTN